MLRHFKVKLLFEIPDEALRLNPQIEDHSELIKELAERYLYLLKKKNENEFTSEATTQESTTGENTTEIKAAPPAPEITIDKVIEKVIRAYDCSDAKQRQALQKSIEADLQNLENNPDDEDEEEEAGADETNAAAAPEQPGNRNVANEGAEKPSFFSANAESQGLPSLEEIMEGMMRDSVPGEKRKIPHITELSVLLSKGMFPEGAFDDDDDKLDRLSKHFIMMFPTSKMRVLEDVERNEFYQYFTNFSENCRQVMDRIRNDHVIDDVEVSEASVQKEFTDHCDGQDKLKLMRKLILFVSTKQDLGATAAQIRVSTLIRESFAYYLVFFRASLDVQIF